MIRNRLSLILAIFLFVGVVAAAVGVGTTEVSAQEAPANRINSVGVAVAACDTEGRLSVGVTIDGTTALLSNSSSDLTWNLGTMWGAGTHTIEPYYHAPRGTPANTILTITVTLGSASGLDDYGSETISFNCTTGEVAPGSTTTTTTTTTTVLDESWVSVTDADPDPVPVGGTGTYSATVHFGNDVIEGDQVTMMVDGDWADGVVDYLALTTDAPGADCTLVPAPGTSQACSFTVALGTDYHFVTTVKVADDAVAPDGDELYATVSDFDDFAHSRGLYDFGWINIGPAETTTTEATTTSITVAPTSIVSTTIAATTTIAEVETDIVDGDSTALPVLVLAAVGLLTLSVAAVRARRFDR